MKRDTWIPADTFGSRLRLMRHAKNLSSTVIAQLCDVTSNAVLAWERGANPKNQAEIALRLEEELGVNAIWLTFGDEYAPRDLNPEPAEYRSDLEGELSPFREEFFSLQESDSELPFSNYSRRSVVSQGG